MDRSRGLIRRWPDPWRGVRAVPAVAALAAAVVLLAVGPVRVPTLGLPLVAGALLAATELVWWSSSVRRPRGRAQVRMGVRRLVEAVLTTVAVASIGVLVGSLRAGGAFGAGAVVASALGVVALVAGAVRLSGGWARRS